MKTEIMAECGTGSGMEMSFLRSGKGGNCSKLVQGSSETMWFWISMKWPWGLLPTSSFFIDQLFNHIWLSTPAPPRFSKHLLEAQIPHACSTAHECASHTHSQWPTAAGLLLLDVSRLILGILPSTSNVWDGASGSKTPTNAQIHKRKRQILKK